MEIINYSFVTYSKVVLELNEKSDAPFDFESSPLIFYEKRFYRAHIKASTREAYSDNVEDLLPFAKENEEDENSDDDYPFEEGEWIEDVQDSMLVCMEAFSEVEIDGTDYLENLGYSYFIAETEPVKYSNWV